MGRDESGTFATLKAHRRDLIDPKIAEYNGRIVKTTGDGLLLEFASVVDAVRCAVDVQRGMAERNLGVPAEQQIQFRIGINVGDIIIDGDDIHGDGVNVAARLQTLADPGGICASRVVRDQVLDKLSFAFEDLGAQTVKNIARPIEVYRIRDDPMDSTVVHSPPAFVPGPQPGRLQLRKKWHPWAAGVLASVLVGVAAWSLPQFWSNAPTSAPAPMSIAVLPFAAPGGGPAENQFAETLTRDVTTTLGRWRPAAVASQGRVSAYVGKATDARSIGRDLNVRYLADGEVRRTGDQYAITVHLVDTASGTNAWSDQLEFDAVQPVEEHSAPATRLAKRLRTAIMDAEKRRATVHPISGSAWDLVLRGDVAMGGGVDAANALAARKLYEQALHIDPNFVPALISLAVTYDSLMTNELEMDQPRIAHAIDEMDKLTMRAVSIDPNDASAWFLRSEALEWSGRWDEALAANGKAEALDRLSATLVSNHAYIALAMGRPDEALVLAQRAVTMEQGSQGEEGFSIRMVCVSNLMLGRYGDAVRACEKAAARDSWWLDQAYLVAGYAQQGDMAKTAVAKTELLKRQPRFTIERFKASDQARNNPAYAQLAETHSYAGLRKAGLKEK
jgi:adenylate cyclase